MQAIKLKGMTEKGIKDLVRCSVGEEVIFLKEEGETSHMMDTAGGKIEQVHRTGDGTDFAHLSLSNGTAQQVYFFEYDIMIVRD